MDGCVLVCLCAALLPYYIWELFVFAPFGHFILRVFVFCHCVFWELQMKFFRRGASEYRKDIDDVLHLGDSLFHAWFALLFIAHFFFAYIIHPPIYKGACWLISLQVFFPPFPFSSSSLGTSDFSAWDIPLSSSTDLIWGMWWLLSPSRRPEFSGHGLFPFSWKTQYQACIYFLWYGRPEFSGHGVTPSLILQTHRGHEFSSS